MTTDQAKVVSKLFKELEETEDKINFFTQFVPKDKYDRIFLFDFKNRPKLQVLTTLADGSSLFQMDDELTCFLIKAYEVKRDEILKEINAL